MKYVGIDIGKFYHYACVIDEGNKASKPLRFNSVQAGYDSFLAFLLKNNCAKEETIIGLEATGHYWLTLFEKLKGIGYVVYVLNPLQVDSFRNENIRGAKTDEIDCRLIAKVIKFGVGTAANIPQEDLFQLRELCRFRSDLRKRTTSLKLQIIAILDQVFPEYETLFGDIFGKTSTKILKEYTTADVIAEAEIDKLTEVLITASRKKLTREHALKLQHKAANTFGLKFGIDAFSLELKCLVEQLEHLDKQIALLKKEIEIYVAKQDTQLVTIPGISTTIAGTILGETVEFYSKDNHDPRPLLAFAGIEPRIRKSGKWIGKIKMSKRGSPYLREAIYHAALYAAYHEPMFEKIFKKQQGRGKPKEVALSYVAKKLTYVIASILRTNKPYQPETEDKEKS